MKKNDIDFNPENIGVHYDEIAKLHAIMDIIEANKQKRLTEAQDLFVDMKEFFESKKKQQYLTVVLTFERVRQLLETMVKTFVEVQAYEKCAEVRSWIKLLDESCSLKKK